MLKLPAVSTAEAKNPLLLPLKVVSVVRRGGRLTELLTVSPESADIENVVSGVAEVAGAAVGTGAGVTAS